jgi:hypothetical protein
MGSGSLLTGDVVRAKEFFMHARDILGDLFDQTDYDIAQVRRLPIAHIHTHAHMIRAMPNSF